jgi:hypothetical protein
VQGKFDSCTPNPFTGGRKSSGISSDRMRLHE